MFTLGLQAKKILLQFLSPMCVARAEKPRRSFNLGWEADKVFLNCSSQSISWAEKPRAYYFVCYAEKSRRLYYILFPDVCWQG